MADRLRNFRLERINRLVSGGGPIGLTSEHLMVLHLLPLCSARPDVRLGTADFERVIGAAQPQPPGSRSYGSSFNMDGLLVSPNWGVGAYHGYVQLFRNGFLEAVESQTLNPKEQFGSIIPSIAWERYIVEAFPTYVRALQTLNLPPPYVAGISLLGMRGFAMAVEPGHWGGGGRLVDRDHLITDEILIESVSESSGRVLRPLFDQIWNGCGWPQSLNYDKNGDWAPRG